MKKNVTYLILFFIFYDTYGMTRGAHAKNATMPVQEIQKKQKCPICFLRLYNSNKDVVTLACFHNHSFHYLCLYDWHKKNRGVACCPLCIADMRSKDNSRLFDYVVIKEENSGYGGLFTFLLGLCRPEEEPRQGRTVRED